MFKRFQFNRSLLLVLCLLSTVGIAYAQTDQAHPLTNAEVVRLVKAGFKDKSILTIISSRPVRFDLSTERMIELKRTGVSEKVILAMLARQEGADFSDELWSEDLMDSSGSSISQNPARPGSAGDGSTIDIFGSSGGSKGSTKTRGGSGSSSGDIVTTGSATVRILRPPAEAGANPKLEKTAPLNNDAIVELVEAGFSEGTIIRRIEQSSVEFNLSTESLVELRKHRVSEKILSAMKSAMGVDANASSTPTENVSPKQ